MKKNFGAREGLSIPSLRAAPRKEGLTVVQGTVERRFPPLFRAKSWKDTVVFLDPPRQGLEAGLARFLSGQSGIQRLVYLSCDLPILIRDLKLILSQGKYRVESIIPYDMFPRTKHIEVIALLSAVNI